MTLVNYDKLKMEEWKPKDNKSSKSKDRDHTLVLIIVDREIIIEKNKIKGIGNLKIEILKIEQNKAAENERITKKK